MANTSTTTTLDAPEVPILLLGDAEVGKSTFLSYVFILVSCKIAFKS